MFILDMTIGAIGTNIVGAGFELGKSPIEAVFGALEGRNLGQTAAINPAYYEPSTFSKYISETLAEKFPTVNFKDGFKIGEVFSNLANLVKRGFGEVWGRGVWALKTSKISEAFINLATNINKENFTALMGKFTAVASKARGIGFFGALMGAAIVGTAGYLFLGSVKGGKQAYKKANGADLGMHEDIIKSTGFHLSKLALNVATGAGAIAMFVNPLAGLTAAAVAIVANKGMDFYRWFNYDINMFNNPGKAPLIGRWLARAQNDPGLSDGYINV